jgi:hypothetical protein
MPNLKKGPFHQCDVHSALSIIGHSQAVPECSPLSMHVLEKGAQ